VASSECIHFSPSQSIPNVIDRVGKPTGFCRKLEKEKKKNFWLELVMWLTVIGMDTHPGPDIAQLPARRLALRVDMDGNRVFVCSVVTKCTKSYSLSLSARFTLVPNVV